MCALFLLIKDMKFILKSALILKIRSLRTAYLPLGTLGISLQLCFLLLESN